MVRPQAHHEAIQAARQRQEAQAFKAQYALGAAVESSLSQEGQRFALEESGSSIKVSAYVGTSVDDRHSLAPSLCNVISFRSTQHKILFYPL
jgi:hypothetical protein